MTTIDVKELTQSPTEVVERILSSGQEVAVSSEGRVVAWIIPANSPRLARLYRMHQMTAAGRAAWSGELFRPRPPAGVLSGGKTVSEILLEDRR